MNTDSQRRWRIAAGLLCLVAVVLSVVTPTSSRLVQIFTTVGAACFGLFMFVWGNPRVPAWLMWFLLLVGFVGISSLEVYEVIQGQRHWSRLLTWPIIFLCVILGSQREGNEA